MRSRLVAALASAAVLIAGATARAQTTIAPTAMPVVGPTAAPSATPIGSIAPATVPLASGLALDARSLHGARTRSGYRLTGQALVKDACTIARFRRYAGIVFPPRFDVVQSRRPGTESYLCVQHLTWVVIAPLSVTSASPPRYVGVRTAKGVVRVPVF